MSFYETNNCRYGKMIYNKNDIYIGKSLSIYGEWSEPETFLFSQIVKSGNHVIEVGSNIGSHTIMLSKAVGENGKVYAFEPQRHTFQLLCANLALNEIFNVHAFNQAAGESNKLEKFPIIDPRHPNNFGASSFFERNFPSEEVNVITIDSINIKRLDFLKMDAEGYEMNILFGAKETISNQRPIIFTEYLCHHGGDRSKEIYNLIHPLGYKIWYFITPLFNKDNYAGSQENIFNGMWSFDLICIPNEKGTIEGLVEVEPNNNGVCHDPELWKKVRYKPIN